MKKYILLSIIVFSLFSRPAFSDPFKNLWYDGNAEISVYYLFESRYGEVREGKRAMVFVTEPLRDKTLIKPDTELSSSEKTDVIKLNDVRQFNTGIYQYNVMTSVFSSVDTGKGIPLLSAVKVSFTSQEWCGNVFEILKREGNRITGNLFSYFEKDGEKSYNIKTEERIEPEDNLWLMVRELKGPLLNIEETIKIKVIPSSWYRRKAHVPLTVEDAVISKKDSNRVKTRIGRFDANLFTWTINGTSTNVWVEKDYPHRILKWEERDGSKGVLASTTRIPYWKMNQNSFEYMRRRLKVN